ncbi:MAG: aminopeptidase [Acidobacteriia bacterium]|nr:aminopeptidase [Terriglobia bacterium]
MRERFSLAVALFAMAAAFALPVNPLHYDHMAERIVAALKPAHGERVMFGGDPEYFQDLMTPLRMRLRNAGAVEVQSLDQADIYLWLPLRKREITPQERVKLAAWLDRGGSHREIHFHWAEGSVNADGQAGEHSRALDRMYQDALDIDYAALSAAQDRAIQLLRSGVIRVRTTEGTDISFRVEDRPFNKQDGNASAERMRTARVRVDREIELPAGVLRVAPIEASVNGFIVIPKARFPKGIATNVMIEVRHGDVTGVTADSNVEAVNSALEAGGEAAHRFREFALGFNPKLRMKANATTLPYYGYGAGVVRMSLGDNAELGGEVDGGFVRWFFFPDATVEVNGRPLTDSGNLIHNDQTAKPAH